ncbi:MAG: lamin tail domain-containing protein [Phycisphaerae bacterium]|nr:lamin tail domain-containing protein [Phycisphaerae bacterium]
MIPVKFKHIFLVFILLLSQFCQAKCPDQDLNDDCQVDVMDLAVFVEHWLLNNSAADFDDNGRVNLDDFALFENYWLGIYSPLVINEVLASNNTVAQDPTGQYSDYIEIYNPSGQTIDLAGMYLSDNGDLLTKWQFPTDDPEKTEIAPLSFMLIWANSNLILPEGQLSTVNVALNGLATASTTDYDWLPEQGIDNNISTGYHSVEAADDHWYEVDLQGDFQLDSIELVNRNGFLARLNGAVIKVLDASRTVIFTSNPVSDSPDIVIEDNDGAGFENVRYVRVEKTGEQGNPLTIMELRALQQSSNPTPGDLCADFSIKASGDQVYLVDNDGITIIDAIEFDNQQTDISLGRIPDGSDNLSFINPTPESTNASAWLGIVADTKFSHDRGFYDAAFDLTITTTTPDATIYYTLDSSTPTIASLQYTQPINITQTTCVRAMAVKEGFLATNVDTQTYIFSEQVLTQPTNPQGFPDYWKSIAADYEMDPDIVNNPLYSEQMDQALKALPVMSIATDMGNLFDSSYGIYSNSGSHAYELSDGTMRFEVPTSIEYFNDTYKSDFQVNCGLRIQGGYFRSPGASEKHSFRLLFKNEYGPSKLNFPLFDYDKNATDEFNTIVLRAGANDGYAWNSGMYAAQYTKDEFIRRLQLASGNASPHGVFVHLYVNGLYWGLFNAVERPDHEFAASYHGGNADYWDAFKHKDFEQVNGQNTNALNQMISLSQQASGSNEAYQKLQGKNLDGSANPDYPVYMDVDNYIDYMLMNIWGGNWDWPWNNYWLGRDTSDASTGFKFYCWDAEDVVHSIRSPLDYNKTGGLGGQVGQMHVSLSGNTEYKMRFADHVQKDFFNDGILTSDSVRTLYQYLTDIIATPMLAESARWGDMHAASPVTVEYWKSERDYILDTYLAQRSDIVLDQLRAVGLYPNLDAPEFKVNGIAQHSGQVPDNSQLTMDAPGGTVTVDAEITAEDAPVKVFCPQDDNLGLSWTGIDFVPDLQWTSGVGGVGYERGSGYGDWIGTNIDTPMTLTNSAFVRIEFNIASGDDIEELKLHIRYDDGFIAYINGTEVKRSGNIINSIPGQAIAENHEANSVPAMFDISAYIGELVVGKNVLAVHGINAHTGSTDFIIQPWLIARVQASGMMYYCTDGSDPRLFGGDINPDAIEYVTAIEMPYSMNIKSRAYADGSWSALNEAGYSVGRILQDLRITELMYNPAGDPNAEYIELMNKGSETLNLNLVEFTDGIDFAFGDYEIAPGGFAIIVRNQLAFNAAYPDFTGEIAGQYQGSLNNAGERIVLVDATGKTIVDFTFKDSWFAPTDGQGFSLTLRDVNTSAELWSEKSAWMTSTIIGGTPGTADNGPEPGDIVINEILAHSDQEPTDWIELHNTTDSAINIGQWYLSDSASNLQKYQIASNTIIPANGYIVFTQSDHFGNPLNTGSLDQFALSENGETVCLSSGANDQLTGLRIEEEFGASLPDVSIGRYQKSTNTFNFIMLANKTAGVANSMPLVGPVVISEINYNPLTNGDAEYIELINISSQTVDLYDLESNLGWQITDSGGLEFNFPANTTIAPSERIIVTRSLAEFNEAYTVPANTQLFEWIDGKLSNGGEKIQLSMPGDIDQQLVRYWIRIDRVVYGDGSDGLWPTEPDGAGKTLCRIDNSLYGNDPTNWEALDPSPGL